jgi:hypothetical protein
MYRSAARLVGELARYAATQKRNQQKQSSVDERRLLSDSPTTASHWTGMTGIVDRPQPER